MQLREHLPARGARLQAEGGRRVQESDEDVRVQNPEPRGHARLQGQGAVSGDHGECRSRVLTTVNCRPITTGNVLLSKWELHRDDRLLL